MKREILKKTIEELKLKYPTLEVLQSYNKTLEVDELVIKDEDLKYSSNFEFDDFLYDIIDKNIYSQNLDVYCYYVLEDEFEEMKSKQSNIYNYKLDVISEKISVNDIKTIVLNYAKKNPEQLDLTITLDTDEDTKRTIIVKDDLLIKESVLENIKPILKIKKVENTKEGWFKWKK